MHYIRQQELSINLHFTIKILSTSHFIITVNAQHSIGVIQLRRWFWLRFLGLQQELHTVSPLTIFWSSKPCERTYIKVVSSFFSFLAFPFSWSLFVLIILQFLKDSFKTFLPLHNFKSEFVNQSKENVVTNRFP